MKRPIKESVGEFCTYGSGFTLITDLSCIAPSKPTCRSITFAEKMSQKILPIREFAVALSISIAIFLMTGCTRKIDVVNKCSNCGGDGVIERFMAWDLQCKECHGNGTVRGSKKEIEWSKTGLLFVLLSTILVTFIVKTKQIERAKIEAEKAEAIDYAKEQFEQFCNWLTSVMIIDSNIWMNEDYDPFFDCMRMACLKKSYEITLFAVQFDEISNIKKKLSFGEAGNKRARIAINRIEEFQKAKLLRIVPITIDAKQGAYADPIIVKVLAKKIREGKECTLFSDDKELRVRARQFLADSSEAHFHIIEVSSYLYTCEKILEGYQILQEQTR